MAVSVLPQSTVRVSSVLNRDAKQYGKRFMFDGSSDTSWNSDHGGGNIFGPVYLGSVVNLTRTILAEGTPQWIHVDFAKVVHPKEIHIQFQGGFAGKDCAIEGQSDDEVDVIKLMDFYPEDVNSLQVFSIELDRCLRSMRIMFHNSSDLFGRIIIYHLDIIGEIG